jgi:hypothetical protein
MNRISDLGTAGINWRRGALRLWAIGAVVWCVAVFSVGLLQNENASWFPADSPLVHVKISDTITWDYPAEWGVQQIRDDLQERLAAEDEKDREWAAHVPASLKDECSAIPPTTPFVDQPADCVQVVFCQGWPGSAIRLGVSDCNSTRLQKWCV